MVNLADTLFDRQTLAQKWERPDFSDGVSAETTADYLESIWKYNLAKEARFVQSLSNYPVVFTVCPPWVAAYVAPWSSDKIHYNLFTLGREADHEHIIRHESIHLEHQSRWGSTRLPGFDKLNGFAQSCFARALWTSFDERMILEGYTEKKATKQTQYDPDCSYNLKEVPVSERFDALVKNRSSLSGFDFSTQRAFSQMGASGSRDEFYNAVTLTANQLMLEQAARDMWIKVDNVMATKMSYIAHDLFYSGQVIQTLSEAQNKLKTSPVGVLETKLSVRNSIATIGIEIDRPSPMKLNQSIQSLNIFGEILEKTKDWWKVIQTTQRKNADRAVNVLQLPGNSRFPKEESEVALES